MITSMEKLYIGTNTDLAGKGIYSVPLIPMGYSHRISPPATERRYFALKREIPRTSPGPERINYSTSFRKMPKGALLSIRTANQALRSNRGSKRKQAASCTLRWTGGSAFSSRQATRTHACKRFAWETRDVRSRKPLRCHHRN